MPIVVGKQAPDFELANTSNDNKIKLSDFKGKKNVVLFFFPLAFSPVCSREMPTFEKYYESFANKDTEIFAISVDSLWTLKAFKGHCGISCYSMLSDFHPKGETAKKFGVYKEDAGLSERATIIIDKLGIVRFVHVNEMRQGRDINQFIEALKGLN